MLKGCDQMSDNIYAGAIFVNDIIIDILKLNITSNRYKNLGVECDRNIFHTVVYRKTKYINEACAIALKNLILEEIKDTPAKKNLILNYLKKHLSDDVKDFIEKNPDDLDKILDLSISKFTIPDNENFIQPRKPKTPAIIKNVAELYIKTAKYLNSDTEVALSYLERTIFEILNYVITQKNLHIKLDKKHIKQDDKIIDKKTIKLISYKDVIPKSILCIIDSLNDMLKVSDSTDSYRYLKESIFFNLKKLIQWFFKDYLNDSLQFTLTNHKADKAFYSNKEDEEVTVCSIEELLKKGWSYEDIAQGTNKIFDRYVPIRADNRTPLNMMISRMKHTMESRRVLVDTKDNVVGYWHFFPLFDEMYQKFKNGDTTSSDITNDEIPIFLEGRYNIEFGAVVLEEKYRKTHIFKMFLYSMLECFERLALYDDIFIDEIVTKSSSKDGQALIKSIGLNFYKRNVDNTCNIYCGKVVDLLDKPYFKNFEVLKSLYKKEFEIK
jgi:hypothetical protein